MEDALFNDKMEEVIQSLANMSENSNELNGLIEAMGDNISSSIDSTNTSVIKTAKAIKNMAMKLDTMNDAIDDIDSNIVNLALGIYSRLEEIGDQMIIKNILTIQSMYPDADEELCKKVYMNSLILGYDARNTVLETRLQSLDKNTSEEDPKS